MRNITGAVSDDPYSEARIVAANDTSVSSKRDIPLSPAEETLPTLPPPTRADAEIKNSASFLGCDPVKIIRTIGESAV
jgi:hypothetical protein